MSGYICKCGHGKSYHRTPATGGMYDGTGYGKCSLCYCEGFIKTDIAGGGGYKTAPTYEEFEELIATVQRHFETMGEHVGALDKRLSALENQNCANQIKDILGELYSWADTREHNTTQPGYAAMYMELKDKIAGIQKRYGIGT